MTREELLTKYGKGERNFSKANLVGANLAYADISLANLAEANLHRAYLVHVNLASAILSFADLSYADLSYSDLFRANLARSNLAYANLVGATYGDARLTHEILAWLLLGACHEGVMRYIRGETAEEDVVWCQKMLHTEEADVAKLTEMAKEATKQLTEWVKL